MNYSTHIDDVRKDIGKHYLNTLYYKIVYLEHIDTTQYSLQIEELIQLICAELILHDSDQLLMMMSKIYIEERWQD